uniref:AP2/ERF domain-containing protein n=1 Tax=Pinguiococcus pyrenoidosus TaxID=172671 RepID=A0A7R9U7I6_9STRA|mmetsp:Transcript_18069/g.68523  ORF Transcript_18069/g.68523 Transcript_18069/m.68523 type:complete len:264 (+) Transcript_18069:133-924(+)
MAPKRRSQRHTRTPVSYLVLESDASFRKQMKKAISLSLEGEPQEDAPLKRTPRPSSRKRPRKQAPEAEDYLSAKQRRCKAPQRLMQELEEREFERQLSKAMEASKTAPPAVKPEEPPEDSARAPARVKPEKAASRPKSPSRPWSRPAGPQLKTETGKAKPEKAQARRKKRSSIHFDSYKFDWTQAVPHRHYVGVAELYERFVAFAWIRGRREVLGWFDTSVEAALAYDEAMTARYGDNAEKNFTSFLDEKGNRLPEFARGVHR